MKKYNIISFVFLFILVSCSNPKPRKPIVKTKSNFIEASIKRNKLVNEIEEEIFKNLREKDTAHYYINSHKGFWFYLKSKIDTIAVYPKKGDEVVINYEIKDINEQIIFSRNQLGSPNQKNKKDKLYKVDGEDFITGIQEGIKMMQLGETAVFFLPSNKAFGVTGYQDIIAPNQPLIIEVFLKEIKTKTKNDETNN